LESLTARILAKASGRERVEFGETVVAKVDKVMIHDVTGPIALEVLEKLGARIPRPDRLYVFLDHYSPPPSIPAANIHRKFRKLLKEYPGIKFFDIGEGVCHQVMIEGNVLPGEVVVGADSHTTTYGALVAFATGVGSTEAAYAIVKGELWFRVPEPLFIKLSGALPRYAFGKDVILYILGIIGQEGANYRSMEFLGPGLKHLSIGDRLTIANMSVEGGAKNCIFPFDEVMVEYLKGFGYVVELNKLSYLREPEGVKPDLEVNLSELKPMVSKPPSPVNAVPVEEVEGERIDMAFIGSCTNGRYEDLFIAAKILKGRRVAKGVRLIVTPASKQVLLRAVEDGLVKVLLDAGAVVTPPGCGACFGANLGVTGDDEVVISSSNRNFVGRMGSPKAKIFLASPATVATSAVEGYIADPRRYLG